MQGWAALDLGWLRGRALLRLLVLGTHDRSLLGPIAVAIRGRGLDSLRQLLVMEVRCAAVPSVILI